MTILKGWHPGEQSIHARVGVSDAVAVAYTWIDESMPEQHRVFYNKNLPFVPLTTLDDEGRPWGSILAGKSGRPGFMNSPDEVSLVADVELWVGEPLLRSLEVAGGEQKRLLAAGIGVEFSTRRRNKFAGTIETVEKTGELGRRLHMNVNQAIGNCPKYINTRDLVPYPRKTPELIHEVLRMAPGERLPECAINFIKGADTVFLGSVYNANGDDATKYPSHVGMNQRGGRPGFLRVRPSDGRTIVLPDFSGNRLLTSLGNIEASSLASMTFIDFSSGSILYTTGTARNLVGPDAQSLMPRQNIVTTLYVTGYILVSDALPVRQREGTEVSRSAYSPPVKYLTEEKSEGSEVLYEGVQATLAKVEVLSTSLARFWFETSEPVEVIPGQAAVLSFQELLGKPAYAHMAPGSEISVNDDRVRTWTISSAHGGSFKRVPTNLFAITMREKPGGLVTGALFSIVRQAALRMPDLLQDARTLGMKVPLVGIAGEFTLRAGKEKMLWVAGGIGVTPFLSMLAAIVDGKEREGSGRWDVVFLLATREPEVLLPVVHEIISKQHSPEGLFVSLHLFTTQRHQVPILAFPENVSLQVIQGRIDEATFESQSFTDQSIFDNRLVYICGPSAFEDTALEGMRKAGQDTKAVVREGFGY